MNMYVMKKKVKLSDERDRRWDIKQVIYADETVLIAESRENLQHNGNES